ncbi:MAG: glycosyltransferase family 4 protein [Bacteroidales bacterium]|nr:glycosyltransferase family 4 protein [Bacteroidales bacterium]
MRKICHITSAHSRYDTRIFLKMCSSLAEYKSYSVFLVVADGQGDEIKNGVNIIDAGEKAQGRLSRMTQTTKKVYQKALELNCDIYHIHDPELIPNGLKLKKLKKKVVFDAHEDLPKQILGKHYLNKVIRVLLSKFFEKFEKYTCRKFDAILTATPHIRDKFLKINENCIDINNFPIMGELSNAIPWSEKLDEVCYVGGISQIRGIRELVKSFGYIDNVKLNLVGDFNEKSLEEEVKSYVEWDKINEFGFVNRSIVADIMSRSKAGIVTFHPLPNHIEAQPNKMFEYMSAGLPIITSNFPLWKEIVEGNNCGICVNPLEPQEIADAVKYIIANPEEAEKMGENGKKAVLEKYNWQNEAKKLVDCYKSLLD